MTWYSSRAVIKRNVVRSKIPSKMATTDSIDTKSYEFTHIIAIDFGTSGCGIAVWNVAAPSIENIHLFSNWFKGVSYKCPTILLLDHEENVEAFGMEAIQKYYSKRVAHANKINDYYLFTRFKTDLYNKVRAGLLLLLLLLCVCVCVCVRDAL